MQDQMDGSAIHQVDSNPASNATDCRIIMQVTEVENPEPVTEEPSSSLVPTNTSFESQSTGLGVRNEETSSNHSSTTSSPTDFYNNPENIVGKQTITIRTVHCVSDMIEAFSHDNIQYYMPT